MYKTVLFSSLNSIIPPEDNPTGSKVINGSSLLSKILNDDPDMSVKITSGLILGKENPNSSASSQLFLTRTLTD